MLELEADFGDVVVKGVKEVAAVGTEADDDDSIGPHVCRDSTQNSRFRTWCDERHDVPSENRRVERFTMPDGREIERGKVANEPYWPRVIDFGRGDEHGVDVDADDGMPSIEQRCSDASRPASGVEHSGARYHHCVEQTGFAGQISPLRGKLSEPLHVPL
jgi:hypothetical protein